MNAETSVQLGSNILVLLERIVDRRMFNDIPYRYNWYKMLWFNEKLKQLFFKTKISGKQLCFHTPLNRFNSVMSAVGSGHAYRLHVAKPTFMDVTRYFCYTFMLTKSLCTKFLWPFRFGLLLVLSLYQEDYLQILNVCPFDYTAFVVSGKVGYP